MRRWWGPQPRGRGRGRGLALALAVAAGEARAQVVVAIDAARDLGPVNRDVFGGNLVYRSPRGAASTEVAGALPVVRYPSDNWSEFVWDRYRARRCGLPTWDWGATAALAAARGVGLFLHVNVVRDTPRSFGAWLADARSRGLRVPWVGVGNEPWGEWDAGFRTPARYERDVRAYAAVVRRAAPGAGVVLALGTFNEDRWNREALRRTADVVDAVDYHYYPNHRAWGETDVREVAAGADGVAPLLARLRAVIRAEAPARADRIALIVGEYDGVQDTPFDHRQLVPGRAYLQWSMAGALFHAVALGEYLEGGVAAAMFHEVQGYRFGMIPGLGNRPARTCVPIDARVRRPKWLAHALWMEHVGARRVALAVRGSPTFRVAGPTNWDGFAGEAPVVRAYASLAADGASLRVIAVNRDPTSAVPVTWALAGFAPGGRARAWELAGASATATSENVGAAPDAVRVTAREVPVAGATFALALAAHSVTALEIPRR